MTVHNTNMNKSEKLSQKNRERYLKNPKLKKQISDKLTGRKISETTRNNLRVSHIGLNKNCEHWNWQGGITPINSKIRKSIEYKLWREAVFARDNYTCIWCGNNQSGNLEADHIKPFCLFPELRFAIDNGRTLCISCHRKTNTYGRQALNFN